MRASRLPSAPYWNEAVETLAPEALSKLQLRLLTRQLRYVAARSEFYRRKFDRAGFDPRDLRDVKDLQRVPFSAKQDLRESQAAAPPFGLHLAAPLDRIVRVQSTAGTSGKPVYQAFTAADLVRQGEYGARQYWAWGIRPGDRVVNCFSLSMTAGFNQSVMVEGMGVTNIPAGAEGGTERILRVIRDLEVTVLLCTPSFAEHLAEKAAEVLGRPASSLGVRVICGGGEPGFELPAIRDKLELLWGTHHVYDCGSMTDAHPNIFANCRLRNGKHQLTPDFGFIELIDPDTLAPVAMAEGAQGEYVFTHLQREACPLVRYRSGDIVRIATGPCGCGRTGLRIWYIGRSDEMLIVRGMNVFPSAIKAVVSEFVGRTTGQIRIVLKEPGPRAEAPLHIRVEHTGQVPPEAREPLALEIEGALQTRLRFRPRVELLPPDSLERGTWKAKLLEIVRS
ncbi:MAG: AMP-binding protein [Candidatus Rokubacteria bacterium]|nr:AMP-binding protein [Candidatus Rokubacteria bacterium]